MTVAIVLFNLTPYFLCVVEFYIKPIIKNIIYSPIIWKYFYIVDTQERVLESSVDWISGKRAYKEFNRSAGFRRTYSFDEAIQVWFRPNHIDQREGSTFFGGGAGDALLWFVNAACPHPAAQRARTMVRGG